MKSVVIHDWLINMAGSEKVLKSILEIFSSELFVLFKSDENVNNSVFNKYNIKTSFIQSILFNKNRYRYYLPLFFLGIKSFNLSKYELIISSSHCVAKGIKKNKNQIHICYCHTPVRYAWDLENNYKKDMKFPLKWIFSRFMNFMRKWDIENNNVDFFIANSFFVKDRIKKIYNKDSQVIYPPVDTDFFSLDENKDNYYITVSRMVPYKRMDIVVEAFSKMTDKKLIVIGTGPEEEKLLKMKKSNMVFIKTLSDEKLKTFLQQAKAFIFAGIEDFGILPIEAMSCGTPVIAYGKGGVSETVIDKKTGIFFHYQHKDSLIEAVKEFEKMKFDYKYISTYAKKYSIQRFKDEFVDFVKGIIDNK